VELLRRVTGMTFWSSGWILDQRGRSSRLVRVIVGASFQFHPQAGSLVRLEEVPAALSVGARAEPALAVMEALVLVPAVAAVAEEPPESRALSALAEVADQDLRVPSYLLPLRAWFILSLPRFFPRSVRAAWSFQLAPLVEAV